ncbi:hypothetical protein [Azospirillum endophyticum]
MGTSAGMAAAEPASTARRYCPEIDAATLDALLADTDWVIDHDPSPQAGSRAPGRATCGLGAARV